MEIKIAKHELYPAEEPTGYAVGFSVTVNGQSIYRDTIVSLADAGEKTPEEIAALAYDSLKEGIEAWAAAAELKSPIVGQSFTPATQE